MLQEQLEGGVSAKTTEITTGISLICQCQWWVICPPKTVCERISQCSGSDALSMAYYRDLFKLG